MIWYGIHFSVVVSEVFKFTTQRNGTLYVWLQNLLEEIHPWSLQRFSCLFHLFRTADWDKRLEWVKHGGCDCSFWEMGIEYYGYGYEDHWKNGGELKVWIIAPSFCALRYIDDAKYAAWEQTPQAVRLASQRSTNMGFLQESIPFSAKTFRCRTSLSVASTRNISEREYYYVKYGDEYSFSIQNEFHSSLWQCYQ